MNFLDKDEFLILLNYKPTESYNVVTQEGKERLRSAGIRTSHEQPAWEKVEPEKGDYNFDYIDAIIKSNRDVGMKSLCQCAGWQHPKWMPDEWFAAHIDGTPHRECLSFWNEEAQEYSDNYYRLLRDTYRGQDDVAFFFAEFQGGEGAYAPANLFYDVAALEDYHTTYGSSATPYIYAPETIEWFGKKVVEHFVRKNEILYPVYKEMWNAQQHLMDKWNPSYGNYAQPEVLKTFRQLHPEACIVLIQYTYYDSAHGQDNVEYVDMLREISNCEVIVEAMFCRGLATTTPKAISQGFRGQIIHPQTGGFDNEPLNDWMIDEIRKSHNLWIKSKEYE